ncbi:MAG: DUF3450 domain-containing protein [Oligoflexus sp.]
MTVINFPTKRRMWYPALVSLAISGGLSSSLLANDDKVSESIQIQTTTVAQNQKSQQKVDTLAEDANKLLEDYRLVVSETESLRVYNDQMEKLIASQEQEMGSIEKQINQIEVTNKEVVPLMLRMISSLGQFVELDLPFLLEERKARVQSLVEMMDRADVSTSEKFRRVLEAFQVENEYGRSIEAYNASVNIDGTDRTVDFLRIGRVVLIYQTLDGSEARLWDKTKKEWVALPDNYRSTINEGLKIARRQAAPDLLTLPVPTPTNEGA